MSSDHRETERLLGYLRGEMSPDDIRALETRLLEDDVLRRQLLQLSIEESALTDWAKTERTLLTLEDKAFENATIPPEPSKASSKIVLFEKPWLTAAAAIFMIGLTAIATSKWGPDQVSPQGVARIVASVNADWEGDAPQERHPLPMGDYDLAQGSIDLEFADGAKVSLGGPAAFTLVSSNHIHLVEGNLVARIPDEALGFIVTSPQSEVVDLGTEFGLSVTDQGQTDVHVIDGLVEVLPIDGPGSRPGVMLSEGEARRFNDEAAVSSEIPVASREALLGMERFDDLGLQMLRGSVRVTDQLAAEDLRKKSIGRNWIDLIAEQRGVELTEPIATSIDAPGSFRNFEDLSTSLLPGGQLNSHLLHFRPSNLDQVRGVIRFDQPIVAILCTGNHLDETDALFGVSTVEYPRGNNPFRGLEPNGRPTALNAREMNADWQPDEIVLSQDRHTLSIRTFANTERGYDQIRILTRAQ